MSERAPLRQLQPRVCRAGARRGNLRRTGRAELLDVPNAFERYDTEFRAALGSFWAQRLAGARQRAYAS